MTTLVLASASPRRLALLRNGGVDPVVHPADVDETPRPAEGPVQLVRRLALAKATAVDGPTVLGADTVVALDAEVLGKPADDGDARRMLHACSGRDVAVWSGVAVVHRGHTASEVVGTLLRFARLDDAAIEAYVATGEPRGAAGGFRIQGAGATLVVDRTGCWSNVVGLPMCATARLLGPTGFAVTGDDCDRTPAASSGDRTPATSSGDQTPAAS